MDSRTLVEIALRMLTDWTSGRNPASNDMEILRQHASPASLNLPIDQLACEIVNRECSRVLEDSRKERARSEQLMLHNEKTA